MIEEISNNFYRVEIPLPDTVLKTVNSYIIRDRERNLIIDTGMYDDECLHAMETALKKLDVDPDRTDFFITHCHGDHIGLVTRIIRDGSIVYINERETQFISKIRTGVLHSELKTFLEMSGFPEKDPAKILPPRVKDEFKGRATLPFKLIDDGDVIEKGEYRFLCVKTPGHSKGHTCLYDSDNKILIAGDHLLKDITPGIQGRLDSENTLKDYLSSLDTIYALDIDKVLPGHRAIFGGCRARIDEIREHHHRRNNEVLAILKEGRKSIYEVASQMTWNVDCDSWDSFPVVQSFFATGEAFAHLKYLEENGTVKRKTEVRILLYETGNTCAD